MIFTCDHGEMLGDHGLWSKGGYFDASYHIPLIVRDPDASRPLRLQITARGAQSLLGQSREAAGNVQEIWLSDTRGGVHRPFGWIISQGDGQQRMDIRTSEFRNNTELPLNELREGDELYVYYRVPPGVTIDKYHIGASVQDIGFDVSQ